MPRIELTHSDGTKLEIEYDVQGPANGPAVLMIMGLGGHLIHWSDRTVVAPLVAAGYRVIRFDNRDAGLSTYMNHLKPENMFRRRIRGIVNATATFALGAVTGVASLISGYNALTASSAAAAAATATSTAAAGSAGFAVAAGLACASLLCFAFASRGVSLPAAAGLVSTTNAPAVYTLGTMATDALMLLDHLNIESAHVVGVSMGGMIAQTLATMAPNRVRSLSSVMSTTGRLHPVLAPSLLFLMKLFLFRAAPAAADTNIENHVKFMISGNMLTGTGGAAETFNGGNSRYNHFLVTARRQLDRTGIARQVEAIETAPSRDVPLAAAAPLVCSLVIHGDRDRLVPYTCGVHTYAVLRSGLLAAAPASTPAAAAAAAAEAAATAPGVDGKYHTAAHVFGALDQVGGTHATTPVDYMWPVPITGAPEEAAAAAAKAAAGAAQTVTLTTTGPMAVTPVRAAVESVESRVQLKDGSERYARMVTIKGGAHDLSDSFTVEMVPALLAHFASSDKIMGRKNGAAQL